MIINTAFESAVQTWLDNYRSKFNYVPHSVLQGAVHQSGADVVCLVCGRRWGKTICACANALMLMEIAARTPHITEDGRDITNSLRPGVQIGVLAPTNRLLRQLIEEVEGMIPQHMIVESALAAFDQESGQYAERRRGVTGVDRRMTLTLRMWDEDGRISRDVIRPDVKILFNSAESRVSMQSTGLDVLLVTEAQDVPERMYLQALPMLDSPGRLGKLIVEGISPETSESWYARLAWRAVYDTTGRYDIVIAETANNPLLSSEQLQRIADRRGDTMTTQEWERVYRAVLPKKGGGFFPYVGDCSEPGLLLKAPIPGRRYVGGLDHGRLQDATVLIIKDAATAATVHYLAFEDQEPWEYQKTMIEKKTREWGLRQVATDATSEGGDMMTSDLSLRGIPVVPVVFTDIEKDQMFMRYAIGQENRRIKIPEELTTLTEQLSAIRVKSKNRRGVRIFESEGGKKDDWADSEILAYVPCDASPMDLLPTLTGAPILRPDGQVDHGIVPQPVIGQGGRHRGRNRQTMADRWEEAYINEALAENYKEAMEEQEEILKGTGLMR